MKKIILALALAIISLGANAKQVCKNPNTGLALEEVAGVYSIVSNEGVLPLGNIKNVRNLMFKADVCFTQHLVSDSIEIGEEKYSVKEDEVGLYIMKVGLGVVKIRPSDATMFMSVAEGILAKTKAKKIWEVIKE